MIAIARNPMDVIQSQAHLYNTFCHSAKVYYNFFECYPEWWDFWIKETVQYMKIWFSSHMRNKLSHEKKDQMMPITWTRFEDLVACPKDSLKDLMRVFVGLKDLEGTNAERNVQRVLDIEISKTRTYNLKDSQVTFNKARLCYTEEQYNFIKEELKEVIYYFGYANVGDNPYGYYDYEEHDPEMLEIFNGYRQNNVEMIQRICNSTD